MRTSISIGRGAASAAIFAMAIALAACQDPSTTQLKQGYAALEQSRFDQARAAADQYLQKHPNGPGSAEAMYLRGRSIEGQIKGQTVSESEASSILREAQSHYQKAMELSPSPRLEVYIRTSLGNVAYWLGEYEAAVENWTAAFESLDREDLKSWVLYRIGVSQQRLGRWDDADATFARVQQDFPASEAAQRSLNHRGARAFFVQVAAFQSGASADRLAATLRSQGYSALVHNRPDKNLRMVMVGPMKLYTEAVGMRNRLLRQYRDAMIVP